MKEILLLLFLCRLTVRSVCRQSRKDALLTQKGERPFESGSQQESVTAHSVGIPIDKPSAELSVMRLVGHRHVPSYFRFSFPTTRPQQAISEKSLRRMGGYLVFRESR